ncbi:hydantoinase/oxoprolinase family protein [Luteithermobacter gelatinilyticus]|uniref:hydantoinase/oxoprolinase family protein n=1 Tax=Luteithermobacter gelatinilyticus TaxID=2582913 RepID=UPI001105C5EC|nr:hydantoinase/oxoprolinase family protein [Luteithermobacter gelatinilyticus]
MDYRLGVDVGGTFTDLLLIEDDTGRTYRSKVPSTPDDPSQAVLRGTKKICDMAGIAPSDLSLFMHGTTVATNAILEGKFARVGLIVTDGYRQILQVARSLVPGGLAAWIVWPKPEPLAPLESTIEVKERLDAQGNIVESLDEAGLREKIRVLKEENVEAVTVCLINSFANNIHEKRVEEIVKQEMPGIPVSISSDILPEKQEYERALTTVANSAVRPTVARYVQNLRKELRGQNMNGQINLLRSDGGLMSSEKAEELPVSLLMSGPAGGVAGAVWVAKHAGFENILTLDMGGTSTDVSLIENGVPRLTRDTVVGDLTVRTSSLDVKTVGAGGGSIAHVPELTQALRVGPESAGAVPGPACYGRGGDLPTVTDANVVLGYLPDTLLGGEMKLDVEASVKAVQKIADALGIGLREAAAGIIDIVNENMFGAIRLVSVQQGYDSRDFALMAFGGGGPLQANAIAKLAQSWPVIIPNAPGVLCAYGDATTRMRAETARSFSSRLDTAEGAELEENLNQMAAEVGAELAVQGVPRDEQEVQFEAGLRYQGQGFEVVLPFERQGFAERGLDLLAEAFHKEHEKLFTFRLDAPIELVNLRVTVLGRAANVKAGLIEIGDGNPEAAIVRTTRVWMDNEEKEAIIYDRGKLKAKDRIMGPAIITEMDSTTLVLSEHVADIDTYGNILINPAS